MIKAWLKGVVRNGGKGRLGVGIELFRLDAIADTDVELTNEEEEIADESKDKATVGIMRIYEQIGEDFWTGGGITAKGFASSLDELGNLKKLNIHINSLGGDCSTAHAIHSIISDYEPKTVSYIDGVAASAATVIACASDEVVARFNTNYMIHNPWTLAMGNATAMRKAATDLDKITIPIVSVYKQQVQGKISEKEIIRLMDEETWMTAEEARDNGFVDRVKGKIKAIAKANKFQIFCSGQLMDIGKYHYRNVPDYPIANSEEVEVVNKQKEKKLMTKDELRKAHPELYTEIEAEARSAEIARLAALDKMLVPGLETVIANAKTKGLQPTDIAMECLTIVSAGNASADQLAKLQRDGQSANGVPAGDAPRQKQEDRKGANKKTVGLMSAAFANNPRGIRKVEANGNS